MVNSIDLQYVLEDMYQNSLHDLLDKPNVPEVTSDPVTPEEKAVSSVIAKINTIKKRF